MTGSTGEAHGGEHSHEECYACPVGGLFLTARQSSPDAFEHLMKAASELLLAAKAMVDVAERFVDQQRNGDPATTEHGAGEPRLRRIHVE